LKALKDPKFALLVNRIFNQGADPESIRLLEPEAFKKVAEILGLSEKDAIETIAVAHRSGPAGLTDNSKEEALWLLLASISDSENDNTPVSERIKFFSDALSSLRGMSEMEFEDLIKLSKNYKEEIIEKVQPVSYTANGVPIYKDQLGFFVAYRQGLKAAMVDSGSRRMVGTTPDTSLEEQGLTVDKQLSPQFGIRMSRYDGNEAKSSSAN
jgi:hypothetical protein